MEGPLSLVRRLPPTVQLLVAGTLVNKLGSLIVPYLSIVLQREFAAPESTIGLLMLGYGAGSVASILGRIRLSIIRGQTRSARGPRQARARPPSLSRLSAPRGRSPGRVASIRRRRVA